MSEEQKSRPQKWLEPMDSAGQEGPVIGANSFPVLLTLVTSVFPSPTTGNLLFTLGP